MERSAQYCSLNSTEKEFAGKPLWSFHALVIAALRGKTERKPKKRTCQHRPGERQRIFEFCPLGSNAQMRSIGTKDGRMRFWQQPRGLHVRRRHWRGPGLGAGCLRRWKSCSDWRVVATGEGGTIAKHLGPRYVMKKLGG